MTATDELRAMLDERGVEWEANTKWEHPRTSFGIGLSDYWVTEATNGELVVESVTTVFTPEQAIAVTLGCGTCHLTSAPQYGEGCQECSSCGAVLDGYLFDGGRCPNCRAKVVKE